MHNHCSTCKTRRSYSRKYDSYFCAFCNVWLEGVCYDPQCYFDCLNRPAKPSGACGDLDVVDLNSEKMQSVR